MAAPACEAFTIRILLAGSCGFGWFFRRGLRREVGREGARKTEKGAKKLQNFLEKV